MRALPGCETGLSEVDCAGRRASPVLVTERHISLRSSLMLFILICTLPAAAFCAYLIVKNIRLEHARAYAETELMARKIVADLDRELTGIESGLRVLATSDALRQGDFRTFHRIARDALKSQIVYNFILTDASGHQLINTLKPYGEPLPKTGTPPQLAAVFTTGRTVLTDLFIGPVTGKPAIAMGVPVMGPDDKVLYSLNIGLSPEKLSAMLMRQNLGAERLAAILDTSATIVGRSREGERFVGQKAVPELAAQVVAHRSGTMEALTKEGIPVVTAFARSSIWGWTVATGAPKSLLNADMFELFGGLFVAVLVMVGTGTWLVVFQARRVMATVRGLNDAAIALSKGQEVNLPAIQLEEAADVGEAIMKASRLMAEVRHRAYHDPLTNLGNRALFYELVQHELAEAGRDGKALAMLAIDLDNFKVVNDSEGHAVGDALLKEVAYRIQSTIRAADLAARMGGDEFSVLLVDADGDEAAEIAARLVDALSEPYPGVKTAVSASIGIAVYPRNGRDLATMLENADRALYATKHAGRNGYCMARGG